MPSDPHSRMITISDDKPEAFFTKYYNGKKVQFEEKRGSELHHKYQFESGQSYYTHSGKSVWKYLNGNTKIPYYVKSDIHKISSKHNQKLVNQSLVKLLCEASIAQLQIEKRYMDEIDNISAFSIQKVGNADMDGNDAIVDIKSTITLMS